MKKHILIAEDEENILSFIEKGFVEFDFAVTACRDGLSAWQNIESKYENDKTNPYFDAILLDIMMPKMNGTEVLKRLRQKFAYTTPVIMLTALGSTEDIVAGLENGADDYLVKPFKFAELLARVNSLLRRSKSADLQMPECRGLKLLGNGMCGKENRKIYLSVKEYRLLEYMIKNKSRVLTKNELLSAVWDKNFNTNTNIVEVYIRYLRQKIDEGFVSKHIYTELGRGYCVK
ncbi:MAG: response regulator transcription factor [Bacteroidales bacterium]|nr:response regulator transcription factor [Bacteroidales bacterium]